MATPGLHLDATNPSVSRDTLRRTGSHRAWKGVLVNRAVAVASGAGWKSVFFLFFCIGSSCSSQIFMYSNVQQYLFRPKERKIPLVSVERVFTVHSCPALPGSHLLSPPSPTPYSPRVIIDNRHACRKPVARGRGEEEQMSLSHRSRRCGRWRRRKKRASGLAAAWRGYRRKTSRTSSSSSKSSGAYRRRGRRLRRESRCPGVCRAQARAANLFSAEDANKTETLY